MESNRIQAPTKVHHIARLCIVLHIATRPIEKHREAPR